MLGTLVFLFIKKLCLMLTCYIV